MTAGAEFRRRHVRTDRRSALDVLFRKARTYSKFQDREVRDDVLRKVWELAVLGPTSANTLPMRIVFVKSREAKERLRPACAGKPGEDDGRPGDGDRRNGHAVSRIRSETVSAQREVRGVIQAAGKGRVYQDSHPAKCVVAGRLLHPRGSVLGLDVGPMSGFDNAKVDAEFFPDGRWKSNFLCNMGYGDSGALYPRLPRLSFEEACRIE